MGGASTTRRGRRSLALAAVALGALAAPGAATSAVTGWTYLWADQPSAGGYLPDPASQASSSGQANIVEHGGAGQYTIQLTGQADKGGTVQLSASATAPRWCARSTASSPAAPT